jgi:mannose-6-phosphate isomerase-like protein (cupin superfamily)
MNGFIGNIEQITLENSSFRKVVYTGMHTQLVVMSLLPQEEIGFETHDTVDQFIRIEKGEGKGVIEGQEYELKDGSALLVPAKSAHNIINTSDTETMKLYTLYSPPHHRDGTVHETKKNAEEDTEDHL